MNRRAFLKLAGASAAVTAVAAAGYLSFFTYKASRTNLTASLAAVFDASFKDAAQTKDPGVILAELRKKGVIEKGGAINTSVIAELAKTEEAIAFNGRYYSQTEMDLYSLAYQSQVEDVLALDGHDLMGGDYDNKRVADADACLKACESDAKCTGYTYAKVTHPIKDKHNMCYLKDGRVRYMVDGNYVSGIR